MAALASGLPGPYRGLAAVVTASLTRSNVPNRRQFVVRCAARELGRDAPHIGVSFRGAAPLERNPIRLDLLAVSARVSTPPVQ